MPARSTVKPPLTLPLIIPMTTAFSSCAFSRSIHASARFAFSRERRVAPKPSSTASRATLTESPITTANSPDSFKNCDLGIAPSDFSPALTMTKSGSIATTIASTIAPGVISISFRLCSKSSAKVSLIQISYFFGSTPSA